MPRSVADMRRIAEDQASRIPYDELPEHMREGTQHYIEKGIVPGEFLQALIMNDLKLAVFKADDVNRHMLVHWVSWFYRHAPAACWGSRELLNRWHDRGGLFGTMS